MPCALSRVPCSVTITAGGVALPNGALHVLLPLTLHLPEGSSTAILGAPGAGASTLLRMLAAQQPLSSGSASLGGRALTRATAPSLRRLASHCATDDQHEALLTPREALALVSALRAAPPCACDACAASEPEALLAALGLRACADTQAARRESLGGGAGRPPARAHAWCTP